MKAQHYQEAGVDIVKNEIFVSSISRMLAKSKATKNSAPIGGFSALYDQGGSKFLSAASDGVGTKLLLAGQHKKYFGLGIDLVAMSVNDVICCGARPLFFLDYLAYAQLPLAAMEEIIAGIIAGCEQAGCLLLGGETAEMPGLYRPGGFDLAGFALGEVEKNQLVDGTTIQPGDLVLGLASSGFHANGYSLLRSLLSKMTSEAPLIEGLLAPTKIYVRPLLSALAEFPGHIKGIAHITGSGFHNIRRINSQFGYCLDQLPPSEKIAAIFSQMFEGCAISPEDLYSTFNMGIGLVLVVAPAHAEELRGYLAACGAEGWIIGKVDKSPGEISITTNSSHFVLSPANKETR